jgi:hypothetical protein
MQLFKGKKLLFIVGSVLTVTTLFTEFHFALFLTGVIVVVIFTLCAWKNRSSFYLSPYGKAVLVTGCDTGKYDSKVKLSLC